VAFRRHVESSCERVVEAKNRLLDAAMPRPVSAAQFDKLREAVKKFAGEVQ